ncbi:MAG TPA: cell envelope integrity protein CreD [Hellea balneolensis]|uniref:Cell envelope integrity protein CreD n=1 Tax=Hellea balneolensis TaxID=287478 RepID=A0A7C5M2R5_9PROT|nr:cell envelope integrity protein CreD [Hellea balneolensis]
MSQIYLPMGRSIGLKLIVVCALVLLMAIPLLFISKTSFERAGRADEVAREVAGRYGGEQILTGPILVVPYTQSDQDGHIKESGEYVVFAETGQIETRDFATTLVKRSLFKVPTYKSSFALRASFDISNLEDELPDDLTIQWDNARILLSVSDASGLRDDIIAKISNGETLKFTPARAGTRSMISQVKSKDYLHNTTTLAGYASGRFMEIRPKSLGDGQFTITSEVKLNGTRNIGFSAFAKSTKIALVSDWPHPGFNGRFAPDSREITEDGFRAQWSVPFLARGIAAHGKASEMDFRAFNNSHMGVGLINPVDPYQKINRALKYAVMFIGLVFLTYFLFETLVGVRVHAAQYILIGLAQSIFYLLLLAFSEHIGFSLAFVLAAGATVGLTALYAGAVFGARKYAAQAGLVFMLVYGLLYTLMKLQDFALMVGALASFTAIAGTMYFTRNVDWYGGNKTP